MKEWLIATAIAVAAASLLAACGGSNDEGEHTIVPVGNATDRAFVEGMVPHHEAAIEMAKVAQDQGQSEFVKSLADDIVRTQRKEIKTMHEVNAELIAAVAQAGDLGLSESEMGMHGEMSDLEHAKQFDEMFMQMMIPHHEGAIRMARIELDRGENPELKHLAQQIIDAQSREISEMETEFGKAGAGESMPHESAANSQMDDSGHHSMDDMGQSMDDMGH